MELLILLSPGIAVLLLLAAPIFFDVGGYATPLSGKESER